MPRLKSYLEIARNALGDLIDPRTVRRRLERLGEQRSYHRPADGAPEHLGDLIRFEIHGNSVDLRADGGTLRISCLGSGIVQVRLSRGDGFADVHSYALIVDSLGDAAPFTLQSESATHLRLVCPGISITVAKHPCRITMMDEAGRLLNADVDGAGWQGDGVVCSLRLEPDRSVYGLGEKAFGLNHRGRLLTQWNRDPKGGRYARGTDPIYTNIPLVLLREAGMACGLLFDNTYRSRFDIGQTETGVFHYWAAGGELSYIVMAGPTLADVLARYSALTGYISLPPLWALGFHQCRWGYVNEADVRRVAGELRKHRIPCDAIYLDIDYMDGYRVFTCDRGRFPNLPGLVGDLASEGFRTVAIIDPGVKVDPDYHVCAEGLAQDMFVKLPSGKLYSGPVWPGECYFADFASARVRSWWGGLYRPLLEAGVAGFWNDMNEPAVFPATTFPDAVQHSADAGPTDHRALHNVYGQLMAEASAEGLKSARPNDRPFLISRAGYSGIQRTALTWTGDNDSSWEHLRLSVPMVLNLGLSGQPFAGADVGGFNGDANGELMARWTQLGAFLPFFRNHNGAHNAPQEVYVFDEPYVSICRRYIEWRYRLLPYLYTAFWQAASSGLPIARAMALSFPSDRRVASLDDQFMLGDALMVAPILSQGSAGRAVYLPAGEWFDFWTGRARSGPADIPVLAPLDTMPLFVRGGSVVPIGPAMQFTDQLAPDRLELHLFPGEGESLLYEDDGATLSYQDGDYRLSRFVMRRIDGGIAIERSTTGHSTQGYRRLALVLRRVIDDATGDEVRCSVDGGAPMPPPAKRADGLLIAEVGDFQLLEVRWP